MSELRKLLYVVLGKIPKGELILFLYEIMDQSDAVYAFVSYYMLRLEDIVMRQTKGYGERRIKDQLFSQRSKRTTHSRSKVNDALIEYGISIVYFEKIMLNNGLRGEYMKGIGATQMPASYTRKFIDKNKIMFKECLENV